MAPPNPSGRTFPEAVASALRGIAHAARTQRHLRAHLFIAAVVLLAGWWVGLSPIEFALIALVAGAVIAAELLNTAVEMLTDLFHAHPGPLAAAVKDVSAAAVLTTVVMAVGVGVFVFVPHLTPAIPAAVRIVLVLLAAVCLAAWLAGTAGRGRDAR